ncbi:hypothetical protein Flavo103_39630 [Flavobacterium collinsii]|uniref:Kelch repeat-containing protein n=1 Tax=Flavobacterium collinsii TaxID=1114861 RepID=UPI0022C35988|nr:kelch repeat-containing protein [Flavobacterium collinsii]GIQ60827.1 hypothetical protein Flavo103_39630 [Flavobacterium collinsii]
MSQLYTPIIKQHLAAPVLPQPRYCGAGAIVDNYVYYVGGGTRGPREQTPNFFRLKLNDQFTPSSDKWEVLADLPIPRVSVGSAVVGKKIYVFGGMYGKGTFSDDVHCYDTITNTWNVISSMPTLRVDPACVAVGDFIYVVGGNSYLPAGSRSLTQGVGAGPIATCEVLNTLDNTWSVIPQMPQSKGEHACVAWENKLYAVGGSGASFVFDIATANWSTVPSPPLFEGSYETCTTAAISMEGWIYIFGACQTWGAYDNQCHLFDTTTNQWTILNGGNLNYAQALEGIACTVKDELGIVYLMGGNTRMVNNEPTSGTEYFVVQLKPEKTFIDTVQAGVKNYFNHLSESAYIRMLDTPHVWGMSFGKEIMSQAIIRQAEFERAIVEIVQKTKYRCDISSLNSPDPDWVRAIMGAIDTCLTARMGRTQPVQFRFLFGITPTGILGDPANYVDFKAALIRLCRVRSSSWEVMPEIWMGKFSRLADGILSAIQLQVFGTAVIGSEDTKMTWNHSKIISMDGTEALVGGHNLNMDLFKSYPPVHDVSIVVHGEAAYGAQLFLNQMWVCGTDLLAKESLRIDNLTWVNRNSDSNMPGDPLVQADVLAYIKEKQSALITMHRSGVQTGTDPVYPSGEQPIASGIRDQDLQTLTDLQLEVFQERIVYNTYAGFAEYKEATRMLTLGKYWNGPDQTTDFKKGSEIMKETLIKAAKNTIRMSQMDIVSAWKKNWSDHKVCQWVLEALLANPNLEVQIVVSPLDAGAGAEGDQYSFGSGASRTFDLLKYYMTHDVNTDAPLDDSNGARANALKRLHVAPLYYTDKVPADKTIEGDTYKWPDLSQDGYTATLKQPPLSQKPPEHGVIGSAALSVINASGYIYSKVPSAPGNHAKIMIVDDQVYVVGSDNLYPGYLSEVDYIVEGVDAVNELITSYWNPLWQYSGPHSISGL